MARNELPDQEMERRLREHFEEEARDLRAPDDLWARLQGRLGKQQPPRFAFLRGGATAIGGRPWVPAAAAAVVVVAVGMAVWALAGGAGDSGEADYGTGAPVAAATRARAEATQAAATEAAATAYPTEAAATQAAAAERAYAQESDAEATQVAATEAAREQAAAATPTPAAKPTEAAVAATEAAATEAPAATAAATPVATAADEATPAPTPEPAVEVDAADEAMDAAAPPEEPAADDGYDDEMMADDDMADASYDEAEALEEADDSTSPPPASTGVPPAQRVEAEPPPPQQPADTTFEDYGRIAFVDTSTDAVSTFSLDTDRTSYFLALAWVSEGYTVEPDSVRAEEWINAFDYGYAGPADDSSFAITSDLVRHPLDRDWHIARIALQAPDVRDDTPLNVTLVLDASGSMDWGNRVAIARAAAEAIRQSLSDRDRIAVVHFTTDVIDAYTVEHSSPDDKAVASSISRLAAHDSTNVQAGLDLGVQLADEARPRAPRRLQLHHPDVGRRGERGRDRPVRHPRVGR